AAAEQDVGARRDLGRHPVVEIVVHLLGQLFIRKGCEVDLRRFVRHAGCASAAVWLVACSTMRNRAVSWNLRRRAYQSRGSMSRVLSVEWPFAGLTGLA